ncbi:MAG TPA: hypothetical protein VFK80_01775 [Limnochordia bacterium]|nr:hypothetical protein [Limnochordia bacterium]
MRRGGKRTFEPRPLNRERWAEAAAQNPDDPQGTPAPKAARAIARRQGRPEPGPEAGASPIQGDDERLSELESPDDAEDWRG